MLQKEVADKLLASYGSEQYGRLTIITAAKLKVVDYFDVSPNSVYPVPKVKSTVLIFEPIINKDYKVKNIENLEKISHIFFSRKRKMINKAFKILFKEPEEVAKKIHIKLSLRPTRLTICEYFKIAKFFENSL